MPQISSKLCGSSRRIECLVYYTLALFTSRWMVVLVCCAWANVSTWWWISQGMWDTSIKAGERVPWPQFWQFATFSLYADLFAIPPTTTCQATQLICNCNQGSNTTQTNPTSSPSLTPKYISIKGGGRCHNKMLVGWNLELVLGGHSSLLWRTSSSRSKRKIGMVPVLGPVSDPVPVWFHVTWTRTDN